MESKEYYELVQLDSQIRDIAFVVNLHRDEYDSLSLSYLMTNNPSEAELVDLHKAIILLKDAEKYDEEWADAQLTKVHDLKTELLHQAQGLLDKLDICTIEKMAVEDLCYIKGTKSMPNKRTVQRLNALKMIINGKTYAEIKAIFTN